MKKFLSVVSLLLAAMMIFAMPVFADEAEEENTPFELPKGITKYYATDVSAKVPTIDGTIGEGEYGEVTVRATSPIFLDSDGNISTEEAPANSYASEYIDFWFAYDADNIYVAIHDAGPNQVESSDEFKSNDYPMRSNYMFTFDFTPEDLTDYFRFGGFNTVTSWNDTMQYFEFTKSNRAPIKVSDWVTECVVRKVDIETGTDIGFGDLLTTNGNPNYFSGDWEVYMELKIDRKAAAKALNECYFTDYDTVANAMYFSFNTNVFRRVECKVDDKGNESTVSSDSQYYRWVGCTDIREKNGEYEDYGLYEGGKVDFLPDVIIFGDENTVVVPAEAFPVREETEAPETEPEVTEAPAGETEAPAGETEAPAGETEAPEAEGGCGSAVSLAGIALVATLGTCTAFVAKKKED